mmetsp:Transcript_2120/g.2716  ORF Transcript_2120/g.2716 Transcript_2120/m.2716 type:complete len:130 (-) Transcript_2120:129-518(-)
MVTSPKVFSFVFRSCLLMFKAVRLGSWFTEPNSKLFLDFFWLGLLMFEAVNMDVFTTAERAVNELFGISGSGLETMYVTFPFFFADFGSFFSRLVESFFIAAVYIADNTTKDQRQYDTGIKYVQITLIP